jgi:hypothetical protein
VGSRRLQVTTLRYSAIQQIANLRYFLAALTDRNNHTWVSVLPP